ncbi:6701_t:CDS:1, partial [Scutellospora calospora]
TCTRHLASLIDCLNLLMLYASYTVFKYGIEAHYRDTDIVELTQELSLDFRNMAKN